MKEKNSSSCCFGDAGSAEVLDDGDLLSIASGQSAVRTGLPTEMAFVAVSGSFLSSSGGRYGHCEGLGTRPVWSVSWIPLRGSEQHGKEHAPVENVTKFFSTDPITSPVPDRPLVL